MCYIITRNIKHAIYREEYLMSLIKKGIVLCTVTIGTVFAGTGAVSAETSPYSVVDYLASKGERFDFDHRKGLAEKIGIKGYTGTAYQNLELLSSLKKSKEVKVEDNKPKEKQVKEKVKKVEKKQVKKPVTNEEVATNQPQSITVVATAYTAYCAGCSGVTATGLDLRANPNQRVIAVDPNVIPLGSRVHVEGYGEYIAGDTGGAIKGNRIDVFIPDKGAALDFGRKTLKVKVLK